jgi:hypothetical protein
LRDRRRLAEGAILVALTLVSIAPLVAMLRHAATHDLVFQGADGPFAADQFQYMTWIRQLGDGMLASNRLDTAASDHVFFHPMFALSGLAWAAGAGMALAYLLWKPVAILGLFLGFRAYVRRFVAGGAERAVALVVALFFATPVLALWWWGDIGSDEKLAELFSLGGESLPVGLTWGYIPAAISVALMPPFLLGIERLAREPGNRRLLVGTTLAGLISSWLHPWQGEILVVCVVGALALERALLRERLVLAVPLAGTAAPLVYYFLLSRLDPAWDVAQASTAEGGDVALWIVALGLAPLALPALFGVRGVPVDLGERMLRIWPLAALAVYLVLSPSFPQHAFEGISLPLAIFAVRALAPLRRRALLVAAAVALLTLPGIAALLDSIEETVGRGSQAHYIQPDEEDALAYLDDAAEPGAVLATPYLAPLVPVHTDRHTWVAHPSWTEDFDGRLRDVNELFAGLLPRARALELVRSSRTRFLLRDCGTPRGPVEALRPVVVAEREFGCAGVYRVTTG